MAISVKFPIRYKILAVLTLVTMLAITLYLYFASKLFFEDKTTLIYELNSSNVKTLALDLESNLTRIIDKLKLFTVLINQKNTETKETIGTLADNDPELIRFRVYNEDEEKKYPEVFQFLFEKNYLFLTKNMSLIQNQPQSMCPVDFEKIRKSKIFIKKCFFDSNHQIPIVLLGYYLETVVKASNKKEHILKQYILAEIKIDKFKALVADESFAKVRIIDSEKKDLVSFELDSATEKPFEDFIKYAFDSKLKHEVKKVEDKINKKSFIVSYFKTDINQVTVFSFVESELAFSAAARLIRKSFIYGMIVITFAFLIAILFSYNFTIPIQKMLEMTQKVAKGDFDTQLQLKSSDELSVLASSFNSMTSDLKQAKQQNEEYSKGLEQKVQDRTAKLEEQNVAIKEAQEALIRTTRLASVGEVAGRAAHEVLNPLTNITTRLEKIQATSVKTDSADLKVLAEIVKAWVKSFNDHGPEKFYQSLLQKSSVNPNQSLLEEDLNNLIAIANDSSLRLQDRKGDVDFLLKESSRIHKIIDNMRGLTRVSADRKPIKVEAFFNEIALTMNDVLNKRKIILEQKILTPQLKFLADKDEMIQVFSNLIRNSMQALQDTKIEVPQIIISAELSTTAQNPTIEMRVTDNGPGINIKNFETVFEPTFTTKSAQEGTGLGLAISRRFIRALDGEIIVEKSDPNIETTFLITLPLFQERVNHG